MGARSDVVVIGAGHNGLVAAALLAKDGRRVTVLERAAEVGGILRGGEFASGIHRPRARAHGRPSPPIGDRGPPAGGPRALALTPPVRMFAPQPDGSSVTFWGDAARTAQELRERNPRDADAYVEFDRKMRAVASFLAYVNVATPPDISAPTLADAISGLKVGWAFRGLGARYGREAIRMMPMAVADLVQEAFEDEAVRGPLSTRGVLFTACGPWSAGTAAVFLNDSAGNDGGAAGTAVFARRGDPGARRGARLCRIGGRCGDPDGCGGEGDPIGGPSGRRGHPRRRNRDRRGHRRVRGGPQADARAVRSRGARPDDALAGGQHPAARSHRQGEPRAVRSPGVPRGSRAPAGADRDRSVDRLRREGVGRQEVRELADEPWIEATIPSLVDPSLAPEGRHVMSAIVQSAPRHLRAGDWSRSASGSGDVTVKTLERFAPGLGELVEARQVITPEDLETGLRAHGRPRPARGAGPRPVLRLAAAERRGPLSVRPRRALPRRFRRTPGRRDHGRPGSERRTSDPQGRLRRLPARGTSAARVS